jgi:hypothetical protein
MRSGDLELSRIILARSLEACLIQTPFSFESDRSATRGLYCTINVANVNLTYLFVAFKCYMFVPSARGYNWATLFLGDINTGTWPSRLGESQMRQ